MNLLRMSVSGGILILVVIVLRAMALHRLPKGTFLALWAVAALRLLVPFSLPSPLSVYTLAEQWGPIETVQTVQTPPAGSDVSAGSDVPPEAPEQTGGTVSVSAPSAAPAAQAEGRTFHPGWRELWLTGALLCGGWFLTAYFRCRREFRTSLPVEDERLTAALDRRRLRRNVALRQSDRISAPLTYGVVRPVILLPAGTDWSDGSRLEWVLEHELTHIRRLDALSKLVLAAAACVHWFNPLVWCMYVLANRDIELSCDEAVVGALGVDRRSEYAMALITMEERKSGLGPFASAFSKNAIEERITAIMKMKKRSLAAILAAAMLICGVSAAFATSAAPEADGEDPRDDLTALPGDDFTEEESRRLFALWIEGYEDMTVADYQEKMWAERDNAADAELIERYSLSEASYELPAGKEAEALAAFNDYFFHVYEPLTAEQWKQRTFSGWAVCTRADGSTVLLEYTYTLTVQDAEHLTVGEYEAAHQTIKETAQAMADGYAAGTSFEDLREQRRERMDAFFQKTDSSKLGIGFSGTYLDDRDPDSGSDDPDAELHDQSSHDAAAEWYRVLAPYMLFGLTYQFDDPDLDGNGLTMWFNGKEVRGIMDEQEGVWITEHTGISTYASGAVELYAVYTDGVLTGLREATAEEQAAFTEDRIQNSAQAGLLDAGEQREFPNATREDYDALLTLKTANYQDIALEDFNRCLLDWANENGGAYDRINCDVIWNDYAVDLTEEEKAFAAHTCYLSGMENGQMIRALHTGQAAEDSGFSMGLPMRSDEVNGVTAAWCDLYYDLSYHITDKSACTVGERDACVGGMKSAINTFWQDTDLDTLLAMSEQDVVDQFNTWASRCGTDHVSFCHVTEDHIRYECADERYHFDEYPQTSGDYTGSSGHHSGHHADGHH